ncbi:hypothetical protein [Terribacillus saccharophilus]|uniref:hypothetical protein n=1 Tax=Terribacillus saccharophilus TaxID=361277 RepID=UPI003981FE39
MDETEEQHESVVPFSFRLPLQHDDSFFSVDILQQSEACSSVLEEQHDADGSGSSGSVLQQDPFSPAWVVDVADATAVPLEFSDTVVCSEELQQLCTSLLLF